MIRPEDHVPLPLHFPFLSQSWSFRHADGRPIPGDDAQGTGRIERDALDGRRGDLGGREDALRAGSEGAPDVEGGLFVDPVIRL